MANISTTTLFNEAIDACGALHIDSPTSLARNAKICSARWDTVRRAELRRHPWRCAITRVQLAPLAASPPFGHLRYMYPVPSDYLKMIKPVTRNNQVDPLCDWQLETYQGQRVILSNNLHTNEFCFPPEPYDGDDDDCPSPPAINGNLLNFRYVFDNTVVSTYDPLLFSAAALALADKVCFKITNSNALKNTINADYKDAISEAKKANCFEMVPQDGEQGTWELSRLY